MFVRHLVRQGPGLIIINQRGSAGSVRQVAQNEDAGCGLSSAERGAPGAAKPGEELLGELRSVLHDCVVNAEQRQFRLYIVCGFESQRGWVTSPRGGREGKGSVTEEALHKRVSKRGRLPPLFNSS